MNQTKPTVTVVMIGVLFFLLSGCNTLFRKPTGDRATPSPVASQSVPSATETASPDSDPTPTPAATTSPSASPTDTVSVTIYHVDDQCENLVPEAVAVASDRPMEAAIGKVLEGQGNSDFQLTGYRVSVDDGVATVDLRLSPDSRRKLISLSACEQFALFGSLEETLMQNSQWQIKSVRFTERGEEVVL